MSCYPHQYNTNVSTIQEIRFEFKHTSIVMKIIFFQILDVGIGIQNVI